MTRADPARLAALIARVEAASGPDDALNAEVAVVAGWRRQYGYWFSPQDATKAREKHKGLWSIGRPQVLPPFVSSLDSAASLVPAGYYWMAGSHCPAKVWADPIRYHEGFSATPALALTAAALRARMELLNAG